MEKEKEKEKEKEVLALDENLVPSRYVVLPAGVGAGLCDRPGTFCL